MRAAGIQVDVVNGITAGLAGVSSLGVPLTHREHAHGVVFLTGHAKPGQDHTDWPAISRMAHQARLTLVIYMGVSGLREIESGLLSGLPADTPVAVVQDVSRTSQKHVVTTLAALGRSVADGGFRSPSVIVVGDVLQGLAAAAVPGPCEQPAQRRQA